MASEKLKKYLAYYQKILREDPENIEARLRLAALFKEMGSKTHAVSEYVTVSKLLAAQGLPLEAIAACKAVLELDPAHKEVQFFLARLFAQAPDALSQGARVAKPVHQPRAFTSSSAASTTPPPQLDSGGVKLEVLTSDEMDAFVRSGEQPITLARPKTGEVSPVQFGDASEDALTGIHHSLSAEDDLDEVTEAREERTEESSPDDTVLMDAREVFHRDEPTERLLVPERGLGEESSSSPHSTRVREHDPLEFAASQREIEQARAMTGDDMRETTSYEHDWDDLRETQAFDPEELRALSFTQPSATPSWSALDKTLQKHISADLLDALRISSSSSTSSAEHEADTLEREPLVVDESFEVKVFDLKEVQFSDDMDDDDFDSIYGPLGSEATETLTDDDDRPGYATMVNVTKENLPDIPLLGRLNQHAFVELLQRAQLREVEANESILEPGHQLKNIYIVLSGEVRVSKQVDGDEVYLATFCEGDFFGEFALLTGRDHSAHVHAQTRTRLLVVSEELVHHIAGYDEEIWDTLWDFYHVRMLNNLMASDSIFGLLDAKDRDDLVDEFDLIEYAAGDVVLAPDQPCPYVYLVLFGVLQITPQHTELGAKTLREGEFFGFVASLSTEPCQASVRAIKDVSLLCLPAVRFREIIRRNAKMSSEIRNLLRTRVHRTDLFLTGVTSYADSGFGE